MPTLRERFVNLALGKEKEQLNRAMQTMLRAYEDGPFELPPDELLRQLKELDAGVIQDLVTQMGYDYLGSMGAYAVGGEAERQRAVNLSRRLWQIAPLAQWAVQTWTNFGLGESVTIQCNDPDANEVCQEAWRAERNADLFADDRLQELSNWVLIDGNVFLAAYASTLDGETTFAEIPPEEISEIITDPANRKKPLFYKRTFQSGVGLASETLYYPDWQAFFEGEDVLSRAQLPRDAKRADKMNEQSTAVCILHIAHNRKTRGSLWGYPILAIAAPYTRAHKQFMDSRLTVAEAKAMFVRKTQVAGGSRAVAAIKRRLNSALSASNALETNPAPVAGSTLLENQASNTTDMPMTTGASDAKSDNEMFTWISLIGMGLFPTSAGLDTSRWATALAMDKTQAMQWSRYQTFWSAQLKKIVRIVLSYKEQYGGMAFQDKNAQISTDQFSIVDFPGVVESIGGLMDSFNSLMQNQIIPLDATKRISQSLWQVSLRALGVTDEKITSDETFGIVEKPVPQAITEIMALVLEKQARGELSANDAAQYVLSELMENNAMPKKQLASANGNGHRENTAIVATQQSPVTLQFPNSTLNMQQDYHLEGLVAVMEKIARGLATPPIISNEIYLPQPSHELAEAMTTLKQMREQETGAQAQFVIALEQLVQTLQAKQFVVNNENNVQVNVPETKVTVQVANQRSVVRRDASGKIIGVDTEADAVIE